MKLSTPDRARELADAKFIELMYGDESPIDQQVLFENNLSDARLKSFDQLVAEHDISYLFERASTNEQAIVLGILQYAAANLVTDAEIAE